MPDQHRILILTASAGAGHTVAAEALEHAFRRHAPDASVERIDVMKIVNPLFRALYAGGYIKAVRHVPAFMGWLYDKMDRAAHDGYHAVRLAIQNVHVGPIRRLLLDRRPHLVVHTHYLPAEIVAQLRRAGRLDCRQVVVTTDFETHRMWVNDPTERYCTATDVGSALLAAWGVDPARIAVTGIPVRPGFQEPRTQTEARAQCDLDPDRPVVLLLSGGFGVGPTADLLRQLIRMPADAQLVVIAGRNEALRRRLERQSAGADRPVRVVGFTTDMHLWMRAADLVVTKPGGLTTAEALASELPLVVMNPIPGQETRNSDYLLEQGAAIKVNHIRLLAHRVAALLQDPPALAHLRDATRRIAHPDAADRITRDALDLL
jgi:processive 1,2-diacylglycerol beta-glucosyltransferase